MEKEVKNELKYRLVLLKYSKDPVQRAYLLKKVKDVFLNNNLEIPKEFSEFFNRETIRIAKKLVKRYNAKLKKYYHHLSPT